MKQAIRRSVVALGLTLAMAGGVFTLTARRAQAGQGAGGGEKHPVLQNSIRQLENVKDRLQKAPTDFGGHRVAAIEAINHAINELQQAIQFDKR